MDKLNIRRRMSQSEKLQNNPQAGDAALHRVVWADLEEDFILFIGYLSSRNSLVCHQLHPR